MKKSEAIEIVRKYYPSSGKDLNEALETLIPELKESEDERIKNFLIGKFREIGEVWHEYSTKDIIAWLEKQGESKPIDKLQLSEELYEHIRNTCACIDDALSSETLADINDYLSMAERSAQSAFDMIEKQGSQNLANSAKTCKVEPKFKVGDWVVNEFGHLKHITKIKNDCYYAEGEDVEWHGIFEYGDTHFRLWTIEDAKDGDVLVYEGEIFMIKSYALWNKIVYHCCYDGKFLHKHSIYDSWGREDFDKVQPATEEQRDTLERAMTNAGYRWNKEELKLEKI